MVWKYTALPKNNGAFLLLGAVGQLLEHDCKSYKDKGISSLLCQS